MMQYISCNPENGSTWVRPGTAILWLDDFWYNTIAGLYYNTIAFNVHTYNMPTIGFAFACLRIFVLHTIWLSIDFTYTCFMLPNVLILLSMVLRGGEIDCFIYLYAFHYKNIKIVFGFLYYLLFIVFLRAVLFIYFI